MLAHRLGEAREPYYPAHLALHDVPDLVQPPEKGGDKVVKRLAGRREPERSSFEEPNTEVFLEPRHLCAYRRLLDSIGNLSARCHNAFASGDIVE